MLSVDCVKEADWLLTDEEDRHGGAHDVELHSGISGYVVAEGRIADERQQISAYR